MHNQLTGQLNILSWYHDKHKLVMVLCYPIPENQKGIWLSICKQQLLSTCKGENNFFSISYSIFIQKNQHKKVKDIRIVFF